jgi:23S rRNA (guanosine2251-2'-O)-methyltransferase
MTRDHRTPAGRPPHGRPPRGRPPRDHDADDERDKRTDGNTPVPGIRAIEALLDHHPERIRAVHYTGERTGARGRLLDRLEARGIQTLATTERALEDRVGELRTQGILALVEPAAYRPWDELLAGDRPLLVAADQITDPRNLGAILRAAEAMGATGALITSNRCARLGPVVTRTSAGASELLPVAMETNLARALRTAADRGFRIIGADLDGDAPDTLDLTGPTVLVIGAEGHGLRRLTRDTCDALATIPLAGLTESLNAATAAAILVYEAARQRRSHPLEKR